MGPGTPDNLSFSSLPEWRKPWKEFGVSGVVHVIALIALIYIGLIRPHVLETATKDYNTIALVPTPPPVNHAPQPIKVIKQPIVEPDPARPVLRLPQSQPKPVVKEVPVPEVKIAAAKTELPKIDTPAIPKQLVRTNVFSTGSSAPQTIAKAPDKVQTGGFGDPNGVAAKPMPNRAVNIASAGGFDMPTGAGKGNGTGGAKGAQGVVASAGFGGGVAIGDGSGKISGSRGTVRSSGFGDADVPAAPTVRAQKAAPDQAPLQPAEILSKPVPQYTEEARRLKIEGEVLLEVVLQSGGSVHVVRVVRGLGHGLDESAMRAAEKLQFKPATRNGQPTDSTAVLHVVFQLA